MLWNCSTELWLPWRTGTSRPIDFVPTSSDHTPVRFRFRRLEAYEASRSLSDRVQNADIGTRRSDHHCADRGGRTSGLLGRRLLLGRDLHPVPGSLLVRSSYEGPQHRKPNDVGIAAKRPQGPSLVSATTGTGDVQSWDELVHRAGRRGSVQTRVSPCPMSSHRPELTTSTTDP